MHRLMQAFLDLSASLSSASTVNELFQLALTDGVQAIGLKDGQVILYDSTRRCFELKAQMVKGDVSIVNEDEPLGICEPIRTKLLSGEAFNCSDTSISYGNCAIKSGSRSLLCIPLISSKRVLFGGIWMESTQKRFFTSDKEIFLLGCAAHIANLIETQVLNSINLDLANTSPRSLLDKTMKQICFLVGAATSTVYLTSAKPIVYAQFPPFSVFQPQENLVVEEVVKSNQVYYSNAQDDIIVRGSTKERNVQTVIGLPLTTQHSTNDVIQFGKSGVLVVDFHNEPHKSLIETLRVVANSISVELRKSLSSPKKLSKLEHVTQTLLEKLYSIALNRGQGLSFILDQAVTLLQMKSGCIYLVENGTVDQIKIAAICNRPDLQVGWTRPMANDVAGQVLKTREVFVQPDYQLWKERASFNERQDFTLVAGAPLISNGEILGVLIVNDNQIGRTLTLEQKFLLEHLGQLASITVQELHQAYEQQLLINSAVDAIISSDADGYITYFNTQAEKLLGYSKEEVIGKHTDIIYAEPKEARKVKQELYRSENGKITDILLSVKHKDGSPIRIRLSASLLRSDDKIFFLGVVGYFQPINEEIYRAGISVASSLKDSDTFASIVRNAFVLTGASRTSILALRTNQDTLEVREVYPPEQSHLRKVINSIDIKKNEISGVPTGLTWQVIKSGEALLLPDVSEYNNYIPIDLDTRSELAVPVKDKHGEVIGVIDVSHHQRAAFNDLHKHTLTLLAQFASIALENARLHKRVVSVGKIIRKVSSNQTIPSLMKAICSLLESEEHFSSKAATACIFLYDHRSKVLRVEQDWDLPFYKKINLENQKMRTSLSLTEGFCGQVASMVLALSNKKEWSEEELDKCWLNIEDVKQDVRYLEAITYTHSELVVPIYRKESSSLALVGILNLQSPKLKAFADEDRHFLNLLAAQLAVIIENTQNYERELRNASVKDLKRTTEYMVMSGHSLKQILDYIAQQAWRLVTGQNLHVNFVEIRRVERDGYIHVLEAAYPKERRQLLEAPAWIKLDTRSEVPGITGVAIRSGKTMVVSDVSQNSYYLPQIETTKSELVIPIKRNNTVVAVLNIESSVIGAFNESNKDSQLVIENLETLATLAGIAIVNSERDKIFNRWQQYQKVVLNATQEIIEATSLTSSGLLERILRQIVALFNPANGKIVMATIQRYNAKSNTLTTLGVYPDEFNSIIGKEKSLDRNVNLKISINGRVIEQKLPEVVSDVRRDPDYVEISSQSRSLLAVPLFDEEDKIWGVLGLTNDSLDAFDEDDKLALTQLATLCLIATRYIERYNSLQKTYLELQTTKGLLDARTALTWVAARKHEWRNNSIRDLALVEVHLDDLRDKARSSPLPNRELLKQIVNIKQLIAKMQTALDERLLESTPLEARIHVFVNDLIRKWFDELKQEVQTKLQSPERIEFELQLDSNAESHKVLVNPGWLKIALTGLTDNALKSMQRSNKEKKKLTVTSLILGNTVDISLSDTGDGIPKAIAAKLFKEPIADTKGNGIGALISDMIIKNSDGEIFIGSSSPLGTTLIIRLPIVSVEK